jgi:gliding motility-associated-like protein
LVVLFPRLQGEEDSFKQIEVIFAVPVLRFGTEFSGFVFDSEDPDQIKQQIRPGNSTFRFSGDALAVNTPVGGQLLVDVNAAPNPFTPNGDGLNEALQIAYKLREVTADRSVRLSIYNLAGQLVIELPPITARSGEFIHHWDGRDQVQRLVPPGTYVYRLQLDAENQEEHTGTLSVAY